jgi:methyl acetate hydrolase
MLIVRVVSGYGWAGTYHFIDPTTGVAAVLGSQIIPTRDAEVVQIWEKLETVLYSGLVLQSESTPYV